MDQQEVSKLEELRKSVVSGYIAVIVFIALTVLSFIILPIIGIFLLIGSILFLGLGPVRKQMKFSAEYKRVLVEGALKNIFTELVFYPKKGLSKDVIKKTEMMSLGNRYYSNDYISGRYKGIFFEQADVCIQNVTSDGKHTHTTTYFHGRWMIFEFNKYFACELQVRGKSFSYAKKSGGWFSSKQKMNKIKLEDVQFNKEFSIYAVNDHEAYYILTPHMMDNIRRLNMSTKGDLLMCFVDNRLHVALNNNEDAFEASILTKINADKVINGIYASISVITRFVDEMDLDKNIFKN